ncbi:hypothetical protein JCM30237_16310 [Halolamina litorea]|uniref:Uncharacterized protein n=1 Tax=Halolamina litorea TaxID=1515593 RepID=A0ABD6BSI8_9EURY|nr:hypothetical protein [Halolamina litorea]
MADLQSCYFCGAPDDVNEYAVVPERLGGGDRSVALCPDCKTKLLRVMEPLIERAEAGADAGNSTTAAPSAADSATATDDSGITMSPGGAGSGSGGEPTPPSADGTAAVSDTPSDPKDTPPSYRRAMRMLSNRPFPMDRSEVESMLATAYDLEREEIDAVLERAEADGKLVAENGEIREA